VDKQKLRKIAGDLKKEALSKGCVITMPTFGMSMFPFLEPKDEITIKSVPANTLKCGDIVLFESSQDSDKLIAHRLIQRLNNNGKLAFMTKGDFLFSNDKEPVLPEALIGKVIRIKKTYVIIDLEGFFGNAINLILFLISLTRTIALLSLFIRKAKALLARTFVKDDVNPRIRKE
jgi:signal peptidase I